MASKTTRNSIEFDRWFLEAKNDQSSGNILFLFRRYNNAVFYFVQAAEKTLKGLLAYYNVKSWGHSLSDLLDLLEKCGIKSGLEIKLSCREIERHYMSSRYPDISPQYSPRKAYDRKIAKDIKNQVKRIFLFVEEERRRN